MLIVGLALGESLAVAQTSPISQLPQSSQAEPTQQSLGSQSSPPAQSSQAQAPSPSKASPPRYSADGLYNLANSYARAGKPGLAVLNYERAALLAPDDADINANLEYVRASAHVASVPGTRFSRIGKAVNPASAAWIGVAGIALIGAGLLLGKRTVRFRWARAVGITFGVVLIALTVFNAMFVWPRMREAVILVNQTPARVTPVPMGDTAFVLPEAETVTMTAEHEDFVLVRTRGGSTGWVARANLGAVVP
jgi:hypothetical protein